MPDGERTFNPANLPDMDRPGRSDLELRWPVDWDTLDSDSELARDTDRVLSAPDSPGEQYAAAQSEFYNWHDGEDDEFPYGPEDFEDGGQWYGTDPSDIPW